MTEEKHECPVCGKEHDTEISMKIHRGRAHTSPWDDPEKLRELYHGEGMSQAEIGEHFGTSRGSIQAAMNRHDIEKRKSYGDPTRPAHHSFHNRDSRPIGTCDERVSSWVDGSNRVVKVHRLLAVACGKLEPSELWDSDLKVHHKSGHGWDNRPENLEVLTQEEHRKEHSGSPYRTTTE